MKLQKHSNSLYTLLQIKYVSRLFINAKFIKKAISLYFYIFCVFNSEAQVTLSTDFTGDTHKKAPLHNIWNVANRISPTNGANVRNGIDVNLVRMVGGIRKKVDSENVPNLDFDPCRYDSTSNIYVYNWEPLISRINNIVNSQTKIHQFVLDQPPWAFQHGYTFIPEGTRDNVNFREDERVTTYGNSLPPADKVAYHDFIKALITKLVETYGEEMVLSWQFRVGSEIETPDHWKGTKQDFIEHFANTEKAIRAILPNAKVGVHTRPPDFVYKDGAVLNYKGERIESFAKDLIEYCYDHGIQYDFWGISDYILINRVDFRNISGKYLELFADLVNHPKWNANATLDLMEYSTVTTMNGADGNGYINCLTSHTEIIELAFSNLFYRESVNGLEKIYRWGQRPGTVNPAGIRTLNTMLDKLRFQTEIAGSTAMSDNEIDAIFAKGEDTGDYDVLIYNFNSNSLNYEEEESVNLEFLTDLSVGTTMYYRDLAYGKANNTLQNFLEDEPASGWIKDGFDRKGDPNRTLNEAGAAAYSSFTNPNPYEYGNWNTFKTVARTDGKVGSLVKINTTLASFAFKKFEFRLTPGEAKKITPAKLQWTSNSDFQTFSSRHVSETIATDILKLDITGNYPAIMHDGDVTASLYNKFRIVLKNESTSDIFYFAFYKNDTKYQIRFTPTTNDTAFNSYTVELSTNSNWNETINSIQIETGNKVGTGVVSIDTMEFVPNENSGTLSVNLQIEGSGLLSHRSGTCFSGQEFAIEATPIAGWQFDGWIGDVTSSENPLPITVTNDMSITAVFSEIKTAIKEVEVKTQLVYPNPSNSGIFYLEKNKDWGVYAIMGECIAKGVERKVNLSEFPKGIYVIKTEQGTSKIIYQ